MDFDFGADRLPQPRQVRSAVFAKYAQHAGQLSNSYKDGLVHIEGRLANIAALCAAGAFFDNQPLLRNLFIWGHARVFCNHALVVGKPELARVEYDLVRQTLEKYPAVFLDGVQYDENYERRVADLRESTTWRRIASRISTSLTQPGRRRDAKEEFAMPPRPSGTLRARLHAQEALSHEARSNLLSARASWHAAALSAGLLSPEEAGYRTDRKYGWAEVAS